MRDRDGAAIASVVSFQPQHLAKAEDIAAEYQCMSEAVYYEAGSESTSGQLAVAEVIANRVKDHRYPNSVCGVVYQGATRTTGCQFTFTCDGAMGRKPTGRRWDKARLVASQVMMGLNETRTGEATHYHATYVDPVWNSGLVRTQKIGAHIFYRFPRGAEWASAQRAMDQRRSQRRRPTIVPVSAATTVATSTSLNVLSPAP
jgi:spore germination cell wall hydrolase CwlJ-like protein